MKGENKLKVLEFLENSGQALEELFFIFTVPYGTSFHRAEYLLYKKRNEDLQRKSDAKARHRFHELLYRLRKEGLVAETKKDNGSFFKLSEKGRSILAKLRFKSAKALPPPKYEIKDENSLKIVIFDIPEEKKRHRDWLRCVLKNLNFTMLQKSVWTGKTKIPEALLYDFKKLDILPYIEILAVTKSGTLKKIE